MKPSQDLLCLRLANGRSINLTAGAVLKDSNLAGTRRGTPDGAVAAVKPDPLDPNLQSLQNLSRLPWSVRLPNGGKVNVAPGRNIRLTPGTRINFGLIEGEMARAPQQPAGEKSKTWPWAGIACAALCLLAAGGWFFGSRFLGAGNAPPLRRPEPEPVNQPERTTNGKLAIQKEDDTARTQAPARVSAPIVFKKQPAYHGVYELQAFIDFDCLDGAAVDPANGNVSLYGHRSSPDRFLRIPYFDHLGTALDCKAPTFSLEWTRSSYAESSRAMAIGAKAILEAVTRPFDDKEKLTFAGAWFLQQNGVPAAQGMTKLTTLAWMLLEAGHQKSSEVMERIPEWLEADRIESPSSLALYKTLGVDAVFDQIMRRETAGEMSLDAARDEFVPQFLNAFAVAFGWDGKRYTDRYSESRRNDQSATKAYYDARRELLKEVVSVYRSTLDELLKKGPEISVPPPLMKQLTGVSFSPRVQPVFNDLPARSLMGRTAFEADLLLKGLICAPWIKKVIPDYHTLSEFLRTKGNSTSAGRTRVWISPGRFELLESRDGRTMSFGRTPMKFNFRKETVDASSNKTEAADPLFDEYANDLTSHYDVLAQHFPILHEVRECVKAMAIARWLEKRGVHISLPKQGRESWTPPAEVGGRINVLLTYEHGASAAFLVTSGGGVDLTPWTDVRNDQTLRDAVGALVPTKEALDKEEKDLLAQLSNATTAEEKAALEVKLFHVRAAKGDKAGATKAWDQAIRDQGTTNAAFKAESDFEAANEAAGKAALFPGAGKSMRNPNGGVALPFPQQPNVQPGDLTGPAESDWVEAQKFYYQGFKPPPFPHHWQEPPIVDEKIARVLDDPKYHELRQLLKDRQQLVEKSQTAPPQQAEEYKQEAVTFDTKIKEQQKEIIKRDFGDAPDSDDHNIIKADPSPAP